MELKLTNIKRLNDLQKHLEEIIFPFPSPKIPDNPLGFRDKFSSEYFNYNIKHIDIPPKLYFKGEKWSVLNSPLVVGIGGTESPSSFGSLIAILIAQSVCKKDGTIISGGVIGIDMMAHLGAIDAGGNTIAVLANNVESGIHPYFPRRILLEKEILNNGGFLSEYCDYGDRFGDRLLQRDRIITALSDIFFAIECNCDGATVDTAKRAYLQGKEVLTIDWENIRFIEKKPNSSGNNQLINDLIAKPYPQRPIDSLEEFEVELNILLNRWLKY